jgi:3-deoxy-D-manno-octulosonic-acid transferase
VKSFLALFFYRLIFLLLTPIILILFLFRSKNNSQYRQRLLERLGVLSNTLAKNSIIIHAASVGEVIAIKQFVLLLQKNYPQQSIIITTFTPTGSAQVKKQFQTSLQHSNASLIQHCYFPLDNSISCRLFLKKLQPKAIVFMETELWPNIVAQSSNKHIPLLLINGRLSARSCRQYNKIAALITPCIQRFNYILTQSEDHRDNFIALGAAPTKCCVSGNLKYDISLSDDILVKADLLKQHLATLRTIWVVASTHEGDDELILTAFKELKEYFPDLLLLLAPRHPERFAQVADLCGKQGFNVVRRSSVQQVMADDDIWLFDTLGELVAAYCLADIVTIAGTFSHIGGHNPLEAALFKKPIILGADMANFADVLMQLKQKNAVVQLANNEQVSDALVKTIQQLLLDKPLQKVLGENAYQVVIQNQGASERSVQKLLTLIN